MIITKYTITCDWGGCREELHNIFYRDRINDALKENSWKQIHNGGGIEYYCPIHYAKYLERVNRETMRG